MAMVAEQLRCSLHDGGPRTAQELSLCSALQAHTSLDKNPTASTRRNCSTFSLNYYCKEGKPLRLL